MRERIKLLNLLAVSVIFGTIFTPTVLTASEVSSEAEVMSEVTSETSNDPILVTDVEQEEQEPVDTSDIPEESVVVDAEPSSPKTTSTRSSNKIVVEKNYNGSSDTRVTTYNSAGTRILIVQKYSNGKIHYKYDFYASGRVKTRKTYRNDRNNTLASEYKQFDLASGQFAWYDNFYGNGKKSKHQVWNSKGYRTSYQENYSNGKKKSLFTYYSNGRIKERRTYRNDRKNTIATKYKKFDQANGQLAWYDNFYTNGKISKHQVWASNGVNKNYRENYTNGKPKKNYLYHANGKVRERKLYYSNGNYKEIRNYYINASTQRVRKYNTRGKKTFDREYWPVVSNAERQEYINDVNSEIFSLINKHRVANGSKVLKPNASMDTYCKKLANSYANNPYAARPSNASIGFDMFVEGYLMSENAARTNLFVPADMVELWTNSRLHNEDQLDPDYEYLSVQTTYRDGMYYTQACFGDDLDSLFS